MLNHSITRSRVNHRRTRVNNTCARDDTPHHRNGWFLMGSLQRCRHHSLRMFSDKPPLSACIYRKLLCNLVETSGVIQLYL